MSKNCEGVDCSVTSAKVSRVAQLDTKPHTWLDIGSTVMGSNLLSINIGISTMIYLKWQRKFQESVVRLHYASETVIKGTQFLVKICCSSCFRTSRKNYFLASSAQQKIFCWYCVAGGGSKQNFYKWWNHPEWLISCQLLPPVTRIETSEKKKHTAANRKNLMKSMNFLLKQWDMLHRTRHSALNLERLKFHCFTPHVRKSDIWCCFQAGRRVFFGRIIML